MTKGKNISIWFFIGVLLLIYGVLILTSGLLSPTPTNLVLAELQAPIWWGILLLALGGTYTFLFFPRR
ncbi:MAG: hypothetical protein SGI92_29935 [Bryobacteraceae bacterium]|nr:hypothetical protein [Bryobacteraceae bacterium]